MKRSRFASDRSEAKRIPATSGARRSRPALGVHSRRKRRLRRRNVARQGLFRSCGGKRGRRHSNKRTIHKNSRQADPALHSRTRNAGSSTRRRLACTRRGIVTCRSVNGFLSARAPLGDSTSFLDNYNLSPSWKLWDHEIDRSLACAPDAARPGQPHPPQSPLRQPRRRADR
jgi:hypothetical protein